MVTYCWSCQEGTRSSEPAIKKYFDLGAVIQDQINWLDSLNPMVKKLAIIDGQREEQIDTVNWDTELIFFEESDLNKPFLIDIYDSEQINENGLKKIIYHPFDPTNLGIVRLMISRNSSSGQLAKVESIYEERNTLYANWRKATMNFSLIDKIARPSSYQVEGWQKVIFMNRVDYTIKGEIQYP